MFKGIKKALRSIAESVSALPVIAAELTRIANALRRPPMPGIFTLSADSGENDMLNFKVVGLLPPLVVDVVKRELSVTVNDGEPTVQEVTDLEQTEVGGFSGPDNATVLVSLVDVDDAGNRSEPRELSFTLTDTIAPPQPREFGVAVETEE